MINFLLVGDSGTGKTSFAQRIQFGTFKNDDNSQITEKNKMIWNTNIGEIEITLYDPKLPCAPIEDVTINGIVLFFSLTDFKSYTSLKSWLDFIQDNYGLNIPIILVGNKCEVDIDDYQVKLEKITFHRKHNLKIYLISNESCYNNEKPLLYLLRQVTGIGNLYLVDKRDVTKYQ